MQLKNGSLQILRLFGVNVYIHWSWLLIAIFQINQRNNASIISGHPQPLSYHIALYLCLFLIVTIHEFGHALACKSVGGRADRIVLWPLGGLAFVQPPQRPAAVLWSIAAGPLVNVILLPITIIPAYLMYGAHLRGEPSGDFLFELAIMNAFLLIFNLLPFYPLDGGQILRSLLWFIFGRSISLIIAAILGLAGAAGLAILALWAGAPFFALLVAFMAFQSFSALKSGMALRRMEKAPRHADPRCPACRENPPAGIFWRCPCGAQFDTFVTGARCPRCSSVFEYTACPLCHHLSPLGQWYSAQAFPVITQPTPPAPPERPAPSDPYFP